MTEIEEERAVRIAFARRLADALEELDLRLLGKFQPVLGTGPIQALRLHLRLRPGADRHQRKTDVDEDAIAVGEELDHLLDLAAEIIEIGRVEIEERPARPERLTALADQHAFRRDDAPARILARRKLIPAGRDIDRRVDPVPVERIESAPASGRSRDCGCCLPTLVG